jgi:hypothetical protein
VQDRNNGDAVKKRARSTLKRVEAAAYLGIKSVDLINLVELDVLHPHLRSGRLFYQFAELKKYRGVAQCPQCRDFFRLTGSRKFCCRECEDLPPADSSLPDGNVQPLDD